MEAKDYVTAVGTFLSAILVIAGWLVARRKDQEQERYKLRHTRREELVKAFLAVDEMVLRTSGAVDKEANFISAWIRFAGMIRYPADYFALAIFGHQ